ncbi:EbsA family protein [Fructilactobacillus carniphilus]|uniref:EbsA family protein n=1 Tax=Fructilactobacillus carniphilus TaxID=2940297 RepID=A0ABY5BX65_9LACO|nr:EbsA family protein [Fructilactobacillus carniphilus]USS91099.1 EbsA family protein [Fructilactobacillus carniphilus]
MITQKRKFLYQPQPTTSIICWSWTLIVLLVGVIIWLEITQFQNITFMFFLAFVALTWIQIYFRKMLVWSDTIEIRQVLNPFGKKISLQSISRVQAQRNSIAFNAGGRRYKFLLPANSVIELEELLTKDRQHE